MAVFYLDTSAVLKRYKTENGTDVVNELYASLKDSDALLTSHFTCLEFESAAARAFKGGILNDEAYGKMLAAFASDLDSPLTIRESSDFFGGNSMALDADVRNVSNEVPFTLAQTSRRTGRNGLLLAKSRNGGPSGADQTCSGGQLLDGTNHDRLGRILMEVAKVRRKRGEGETEIEL